jgi:magnesium-transporting ATPase (P-type)
VTWLRVRTKSRQHQSDHKNNTSLHAPSHSTHSNRYTRSHCVIATFPPGLLRERGFRTRRRRVNSPLFPCLTPDTVGQVDYDDLMTDLTLISIIGIEDPLRPGVREAVANCGKAGVRVKMCTGDNVLTAKSIAEQCGIYTPGGIVMEGPHFRTLSPDVMKAIVPRLQVLARSSPEDKRILVETLKGLGDVVGVAGDGTNDGPTLKSAHVGFSMGIAGTEVAKKHPISFLWTTTSPRSLKLLCGDAASTILCANFFNSRSRAPSRRSSPRSSGRWRRRQKGQY